jgi:cytochrome c556
MKRLVSVSLGLFLVLALTGTLWSQGVLKTGMDSALQVVQTRKYLMDTVKLNVEDAAKKFEADRLGDIQANGAAVSLAAKVMPPLFREKHEAVYDGQGKFFKGAEPAAFEAACETMRTAAQNVRMSAEKGDKAEVMAAMGALQQSCGACHSAYRGSF